MSFQLDFLDTKLKERALWVFFTVFAYMKYLVLKAIDALLTRFKIHTITNTYIYIFIYNYTDIYVCLL